MLLPVWPLPRSLATTCGISVDFSSSPYLDVSVQAVPHHNLWIQSWLSEYCSDGFPHSEIRGSMLICSSPQLIAACHVLHRLSVPRHSPCALYSLTSWSVRSERLEVFLPFLSLTAVLLQELGYISVEVFISKHPLAICSTIFRLYPNNIFSEKPLLLILILFKIGITNFYPL